MKHIALLTVDAIIALGLGIVLLFFSPRLSDALGIPLSQTAFYPSVLGAVLVGIGIALLVELCKGSRAFVGLGLGGAICIDLGAGLALIAWLVFGNLNLPARGYVLLWAIAIIVAAVSAIELVTVVRESRRGSN